MQFALEGFKPEAGFRVFAFGGAEVNQAKTAFTVRTDLAMSRRFGISLQELPLLCLGLLQRRFESTGERDFTFTEEDMSTHSMRLLELRKAAEKKRGNRKYSTPRPAGAGSAMPRFSEHEMNSAPETGLGD